jgi:hypothetical protein
MTHGPWRDPLLSEPAPQRLHGSFFVRVCVREQVEEMLATLDVTPQVLPKALAHHIDL